MLTVNVVVVKDTATPALRSLRRGLEPEHLIPRFGRAVMNEVRDNFQYLESTRPNQLGGPRTHYYSQARRNTHLTIDGDTATIGVAQVGIRMRYFGGVIRAGANPSCIGGGSTKYLTIPATAEAYGKRACDFDDLQVLSTRSGPYALARVTTGTLASRKALGMARAFGVNSSAIHKTEILFWLKKQVTIPEDHTMLPSSDDVTAAIKESFITYVTNRWRGRVSAS
jgi:hypothetical protein